MKGNPTDFTVDPADIEDFEERASVSPAKPLLPPRRERAVQNLFIGLSPRQAYLEAGFRDPHNASPFFRHADVAARILHLQLEENETRRADTARARCAVIYADALAMSEAEEVRIMAMRLSRPGAALGAIVLKARLAGLLKHDDEGLNLPLGDMTLDQVEKYRDYFGRRLNAIDAAIAEHESAGPDKTPDGHPGSLPNTRH